MRHRRDHRKLSRTASHRKALLRNLVAALFIHGRIETTVVKAKEARRLAERLITYAKRNSVHSRRLVAAVVSDRDIVKKVFDEIAPLYATREGGYTRIVRTRRRLGDAGEMGFLELVMTKEQKDEERKRRAEAAGSEKPAKKGQLFGRKKSGDDKAEAKDAAAPGDEKAPKGEKPAAKERKPRRKGEEDKPGARSRSGKAPGPAASTRKTRGSQRGQ